MHPWMPVLLFFHLSIFNSLIYFISTGATPMYWCTDIKYSCPCLLSDVLQLLFVCFYIFLRWNCLNLIAPWRLIKLFELNWIEFRSWMKNNTNRSFCDNLKGRCEHPFCVAQIHQLNKGQTLRQTDLIHQNSPALLYWRWESWQINLLRFVFYLCSDSPSS